MEKKPITKIKIVLFISAVLFPIVIAILGIEYARHLTNNEGTVFFVACFVSAFLFESIVLTKLLDEKI